MKLIDYHIHPDFSQDATGSIFEFVESAIAKGLSSIAFTTHIDLNPKRIALDRFIRTDGRLSFLSEENFQQYIDKIEEARIRFSDRIDIMRGAELSYGKSFESEIANFLSRFKLDFVIGSIHCLENIAVTSSFEAPIYFATHTLTELADSYFQALYELIDSGLFDTVGHIDGYKKYATSYYGKSISKIHKGRIEEILSLMEEKEIGMEINTAAYRKGLGEFYPSEDILALAGRFGVPVNSFGSDAHNPSDVGFMVEDAIMLAKRHKLNIKTYRRQR